jgi:hypothetical protein
VIEVSAVVVFTERRRLEPVKEVLPMASHLLPAGQAVCGQRRQPVAGVQIGQVVKMKAAVCRLLGFPAISVWTAAAGTG